MINSSKLISKKTKKSIKIFTFTLILSLLVFELFYGLAVAYINTFNTMFEEQIEICSLTQISCDKAELQIVGKAYQIELKEEKGIPVSLYVVIPPEAELVFSVFDAVSNRLENFINNK